MFLPGANRCLRSY